MLGRYMRLGCLVQRNAVQIGWAYIQQRPRKKKHMIQEMFSWFLSNYICLHKKQQKKTHTTKNSALMLLNCCSTCHASCRRYVQSELTFATRMQQKLGSITDQQTLSNSHSPLRIPWDTRATRVYDRRMNLAMTELQASRS